MLVRDPQLHKLRHFGCVTPEDYPTSWAKSCVIFVRTGKLAGLLSYWEIAVLYTALMQSYLGCCEQFGCLSCQKAAEKQKGVQERKHKCWQVDVPGEILGLVSDRWQSREDRAVREVRSEERQYVLTTSTAK